MILEGVIRKVSQALAGTRQLRLTHHESVAIAQYEPEAFEASRAGLRFWGGAGTGATGRAPTATMPTTAAQWMLWNGEPGGGAAYAIEMVSIFQLSGTAAIGGVILAGLTKIAIAQPTAATGYFTGNMSASSKGSKAQWADAQTLTAAQQCVWVAIAANGNPATTTNGGQTQADLNGAVVVPPGYALCLHYLSGAGTTPLFLASAAWCEIPTALE